ncbi:hypothetical protein GIB67_032836 [Kingdonia uniflora]|uniref:Polygalacturonase n=1 Tax=Kingdonia uniflora TaxID=39325 RepID=A0A7J7NCM7_9MAGN|nr:hypothetical protein GIB67_032836 [Kingdonia uniflora]
MSKNIAYLLPLLLIILPSANAVYNVLKYGAKPDGITDSTKPFLNAWDSACRSVKPAQIYVPRGRYLLKVVVFNGPCRNKIVFTIIGTLVAPLDYQVIGSSPHWILFNEVVEFSLYGGAIDARGAAFWACKTIHKSCPQGARSLKFNSGRNIVISGLKSINSQMAHIVINACNNVMVRRVTLIAPDQSPNTDGIHMEASTGVTITGSSIGTGDDCISIGPGSRNVLIDKVRCGPGHGISIGSLAKTLKEEGVQGVIVKNAVFTGSQNGLRIKSWARASNGFVRGVVYQNIVMNNVKNPIIIDQRYCPSNSGCPNQHSGIKISDVTYQNIRGTSATPLAVNFHCSKTNPCSGIKLLNVKLTYQSRPAQSSCVNAAGTSSGVGVTGGCL